MKTHTPLDGLPLRDNVHYVVVGQDPRDVMMSWEHHTANMDVDVIVESRAEAIGLDDLGEYEEEIAASGSTLDPAARFRQFTDAERSPRRMVGLTNVLHHLDTGRTHRRAPNVGLFHYLDYRRDLVEQMVRLADVCAIDISSERLAELAPEAGIDRMRERADEVVPDVSASDHFEDHARFFRSGADGEWAERANAHDRAHYDDRVAQLVAPEVARWVHEAGDLTD